MLSPFKSKPIKQVDTPPAERRRSLVEHERNILRRLARRARSWASGEGFTMADGTPRIEPTFAPKPPKVEPNGEIDPDNYRGFVVTQNGLEFRPGPPRPSRVHRSKWMSGEHMVERGHMAFRDFS